MHLNISSVNLSMTFSRIFNPKTYTIELFVAFFLSWFAITGAVLGITKNVLPMGKVDTLLLYLMMLVFAVKVLGTFIKRLEGWQIVSVFGVLTVLLISTLFSSKPDTNISVTLEVLAFCLPCLLIVGCVRDFSSFYKYLLIIMQIMPYFHLLAFFLLDNAQIDEDEGYSQSMSYSYLFPAIVLLSDVLSRFSLKSLIPCVICIFMMIAYGARGPLASVFLFMLIYWLVMSKSIGWKKMVMPILLLVALAVYVFTHFEDVIAYFAELMTSMNSSVRVLDMIMDESLTEDEARGMYATACLKHVFDNPFLGTLPINDRVFLWNIFHSDRGIASMYPHNFFVEILTQFGLFLGLLLICLFLRIIYKCLKDPINMDSKKILLVFIGAYFFPLLFSGSYISSKGFYILMAVCIVILKMRKTKKLSYAQTH